MAQKHMTRPPAVAPAGRVTVAEAAALLKMSYSGVYRHVILKTVPSTQDATSGVITIARSDLAKIKNARRKPANGDKQGIMVRPAKETVRRWEAAIKATTKAGAEPLSVARWLVELAESASKRAGV